MHLSAHLQAQNVGSWADSAYAHTYFCYVK